MIPYDVQVGGLATGLFLLHLLKAPFDDSSKSKGSGSPPDSQIYVLQLHVPMRCEDPS
jgi:hypothetical protein